MNSELMKAESLPLLKQLLQRQLIFVLNKYYNESIFERFV